MNIKKHGNNIISEWAHSYSDQSKRTWCENQHHKTGAI